MLPRYSRVSYKKLNGWEFGHWLFAHFMFPNIVWSFSMPLWCNKHLPGQSSSIIITLEFLVCLSLGVPQAFFFGRKKVVLVLEIIFLSFDLQVIFCGQMTSIINSILFQIVVIDSLPLMGRYFCKQISPFWLDNRDVQGRYEVRWRLGKETGLAAPCSNLRHFESKCTNLKNVLMTLL